jgi:homoserine kinase type II
MSPGQASSAFRYRARMLSSPVDLVAVTDLLSAWRILPDAVHEPPPGTNNLTRLIESGGRRYVLRLSRTLTAQQAQAESLLREHLAAADPDFSVPTPIATTEGDYISATESGVATLSAFLPGSRPDLGSTAALQAFGIAAGQLAGALAALPEHLLVHDWTGGPLVLLAGSTPGELAGELSRAGAPAPYVAALLAGVTDAMTGYERLVDGLPRRLTHGDLGPGNVLADGDLTTGGRITGILDFEIAGLDIRVNELVAALALTAALDSPASTRALVGGFTSVVEISDEERDAVADLLVARSVGSVLWRSAAWRRGDVGVDQVAVRLRRLVETRTFVREHRGDLLAALREPV